MPWRRSQRTQPPTSPLPVPDAEAVRRAALLASWQRDRRVAQRRLAWRWALWYVQRYRWYLVACMGLLALLALWLLRDPAALAPREADASFIDTTPRQDPMPAMGYQVPPSDPVALPASTLIPATTYEGLPIPDREGIRLRLSASLQPQPQAVSTGKPAPHVWTATPIAPHLISENWLHSKEP